MTADAAAGPRGTLAGDRAVLADAVRRDLLAGILDAPARPETGAAARRLAEPPSRRLLTTRDPDVLEQTLLLALDLGEPKAIQTLRMAVADRASPLDMRTRALAALVERHVPGLARELLALSSTIDRSAAPPSGAGRLQRPGDARGALEPLPAALGIRARRCDRHAVGPAGMGPGPARRGREQGRAPPRPEYHRRAAVAGPGRRQGPRPARGRLGVGPPDLAREGRR